VFAGSIAAQPVPNLHNAADRLAVNREDRCGAVFEAMSFAFALGAAAHGIDYGQHRK
jgi:hypothetical protein